MKTGMLLDITVHRVPMHCDFRKHGVTANGSLSSKPHVKRRDGGPGHAMTASCSGPQEGLSQESEYFASQSWPLPHSLMVAHTAEYAGGEMRPCDAEIADAKWFSLDALPQLRGPVSISRQLIDATVARPAADQL